MLRIAGRRFASQVGALRPFTTSVAGLAEESAADKGPKAFTERFLQNVQGSAIVPQYPSDFIKKPEDAQQEGVPEKLTLNFFLPHKQQLKGAKVIPSSYSPTDIRKGFCMHNASPDLPICSNSNSFGPLLPSLRHNHETMSNVYHYRS